MQSNGDCTPLMLTIYYNNKEIAKELIKAGADLNIQNHSRCTALISAIYGNPEIARELIKASANINLQNKNNKTAIDLAKEKYGRVKDINKEKYKKIMKMLQQKRPKEQQQESIALDQVQVSNAIPQKELQGQQYLN